MYGKFLLGHDESINDPINDPIKYYPEFFRKELLHPTDGVKHFVTDERVI